jgi:hypothetical protein
MRSTVSSGNKIVTDSLLLYVDAGNKKSYSGSGTNFNDLIGGYNGTLVNGVTYTPDDNGALVFDGVDDYITFGNVLNFDPTDAWSVSIWFNNSQPLNTTSDIYGLISKRDINGVNGWTISLRGGSLNGITIILSDTNLGFLPALTPSTDVSSQVSDGNWHQITLTFGLDDIAKLYLDGIFLASQSRPGWNFTNNRRLMIGSYEDNINFPVGQFPFNGKISQAKIYNKELTQSEVLQNYNAIKYRFS